MHLFALEPGKKYKLYQLSRDRVLMPLRYPSVGMWCVHPIFTTDTRPCTTHTPISTQCTYSSWVFKKDAIRVVCYHQRITVEHCLPHLFLMTGTKSGCCKDKDLCSIMVGTRMYSKMEEGGGNALHALATLLLWCIWSAYVMRLRQLNSA